MSRGGGPENSMSATWAQRARQTHPRLRVMEGPQDIPVFVISGTLQISAACEFVRMAILPPHPIGSDSVRMSQSDPLQSVATVRYVAGQSCLGMRGRGWATRQPFNADPAISRCGFALPFSTRGTRVGIRSGGVGSIDKDSSTLSASSFAGVSSSARRLAANIRARAHRRIGANADNLCLAPHSGGIAD